MDEPTALVQTEGGPCAVIAPVQAFILKQLLFECEVISWKDMKTEKCDQLLVKAMTEIIAQAANVQNPKYSIIYTSDASDMVNGQILEPDASESDIAVSREKVSESIRDTTLDPELFHSQLRYD